MELRKLSDHIWVMPFEEERDRPNLGYIKGDKLSLAVDAGHSEAHIREFYDLLQGEGLPLPSFTVLTHWHWDHTFAMHAVNGLTLANQTTNAHLLECREKIDTCGPGVFLKMHESVRKEYEDGKEMIVVPADIVFEGDITMDIGGCTVRLLQTKAPHTDDSTLVYVCEDKTLFIGDAAGEEFLSGVKDRKLAEILADRIRSTGALTCVEGHWQPVETEDTLEDLLN